jgi:hypothetical protein
MKLYLKRGNKNYKERKLLDALEPIMKKRLEQNPEFAKEVVPATNINELQTMYNRYAVEDVQYVETKNESMAKSKKSDVEDVVFEESKTGSNVDFTDNDDSSFTDPFNRDNPIVRDYVLGGDSFSESEAPKVDPFATFAEPTNFREAFEIPGSEEEIKSNNPQSENKDKQQSEKKKPLSELSPEEILPSQVEIDGVTYKTDVFEVRFKIGFVFYCFTSKWRASIKVGIK